MLSKSTLLKYYKRQDIQQAIVAHAQNKEVGVRYEEAFGKRPDVLFYPKEILELALKNVTSFHCSEELWENPLALSSTLTRKQLDELRIGWDLVLDIDCKIVEYSQIAAEVIIQFLRYCGVQSLSIKFSGNKGFHIGVPFEAFPKHIGEKSTTSLFPEAARKIAWYIKENIKEELGKRILSTEKNDFSAVREKVQLPAEEIIRTERSKDGDTISKLDVDAFLEIDTVLLASRHLYRMPYSLHEKSGLASLPLDPDKVSSFTRDMASPDKVQVSPFSFLSREGAHEDARALLLQALDFKVVHEQENEQAQERQKKVELEITSPISEEFFPPCMKAICNGLEDGRKRGLFCLINFLGKIGWSKPEIEAYVRKWNTEKNKEPLREVYLKGQLAHFKPAERLPPNCDNEAYYKGIGIACSGDHCKRIKNPVNYTLWRWRKHLRIKEEENERENEKIEGRTSRALERKKEKELLQKQNEKKENDDATGSDDNPESLKQE